MTALHLLPNAGAEKISIAALVQRSSHLIAQANDRGSIPEMVEILGIGFGSSR